ncbi:hypothetical protein GCM10023340_43270 [Nocardioides marinquilinus]|uniref:Uncharacterized protein n=1 Tax=Nocardioides marinquilinus TaxID=1210400 RepID=A0ABP9Q376_9ACTN
MTTNRLSPQPAAQVAQVARVASAVQAGALADVALQRVADASVWLIFRISGVRS